jgi:hypothetical protein
VYNANISAQAEQIFGGRLSQAAEFESAEHKSDSSGDDVDS